MTTSLLILSENNFVFITLDKMQSNFSSFILNPKLGDLPVSLNIGESIWFIIRIILLYFGLVVLTSLLFLPILKIINLIPEHGLKLSEIPLSFKLIVFVPIYEEIIFRLPLRFTKQNIFLSFAAFHFMIFYHAINLIFLISLSVIIALIPTFKLINDAFYSKLELIWRNYFPYLYYGLALSFGMIHLANFENLKLVHFFLFPLIVSNQIIMGLLFGYVRVTIKYGFIYCVLLHFFINLPLILVSHL